jgi:putative membrane protein
MPGYTRPLWIAISVITLFALPAARGQRLSALDRKFMEDATKGGMHEVYMGHLGVERGSSPEVKSFSQRLINDHNRANQELAELAKQKGFALPADDAKLANPTSLATKTGPEFDKEFARMMIEDHQKDIAAFEKEATLGGDPDLKIWVDKTLPTIKEHLMEAMGLLP